MTRKRRRAVFSSRMCGKNGWRNWVDEVVRVKSIMIHNKIVQSTLCVFEQTHDPQNVYLNKTDRATKTNKIEASSHNGLALFYTHLSPNPIEKPQTTIFRRATGGNHARSQSQRRLKCYVLSGCLVNKKPLRTQKQKKNKENRAENVQIVCQCILLGGQDGRQDCTDRAARIFCTERMGLKEEAASGH